MKYILQFLQSGYYVQVTTKMGYKFKSSCFKCIILMCALCISLVGSNPYLVPLDNDTIKFVIVKLETKQIK